MKKESFNIFQIHNGWPSADLVFFFKASLANETELGGPEWVWSVSSNQLKHAVVKWVQDSQTEGNRDDRDQIQKKMKGEWYWKMKMERLRETFNQSHHLNKSYRSNRLQEIVMNR